jgi:hypothetical protein
MKEQSEEYKKKLRAAAEALFLELDEEFSKKPKAKAAKPKPAATEPKPAPLSEGKEANRIAMLMGADSPWRPVARVAHLVTQICRCCKGEQEYLGNMLIRHEHKTRKHVWDCQLPAEPSHARLPQIIDTTTLYIDECPTCIRFDMHLQPIDADNIQLSIF